MTLPTHVASSNEPIPAPWGDRCDGPDLRYAHPVEIMLADLRSLDDDDFGYVALWAEHASAVGAWVILRISREGERLLMVGAPCDAQTRHRSRWLHFLVEDLKRIDGRREVLLDHLHHIGHVLDERRRNPSATTLAIRDYLRSGGRVLLTPDGNLEEGSTIPGMFVKGPESEITECLRAHRAYFNMRKLFRCEKQIKRIIRTLGRRTTNGWTVLEAQPSETRIQKRGVH